MSKIASIVACGLVASLFSFSAEAFPGSPSPQVSTSDVMQVRDFCGLGFHRNPWGTCVPNGTPYGYVAPGYVAPVVVAPPAVVVAPRVACPYGYYYYPPYNRCVPTP